MSADCPRGDCDHRDCRLWRGECVIPPTASDFDWPDHAAAALLAGLRALTASDERAAEEES